MQLRSLAWKFTLAFLLVGVIGVLLFALIVGQRTRTEFDRFLSARDQGVLVDALADYYATHASWAGIQQSLASSPALDYYSRSATLADREQTVIFATEPYTVGQKLPAQAVAESTPVRLGDQIVGYVHFIGATAATNALRTSPEADFLHKVIWAALMSGLIAALIALTLGGLLARTMTKPLRELTTATRAMADGQLDQRVVVRSQDEIGELAAAFNQMSGDLARASQARKQMTADLAHDLRTPLSILRGYMEGLKEGQLTGSPPLYTIMYEEILHLQRLVEDLRVLSLADAGELSLNRRPVDPNALLERTALAYWGQVEQQGLTLRVEPAEGLPSVAVDTDRISQVLNNLVSNALRHTSQGEIVLTSAQANGHVLLRVRDTGAGIAPEHLPLIFDRFYRADPARQRVATDSSGLGLAIAKAIVEAHDGDLTVASALGHGTTFTIALPVGQPTLSSPALLKAVKG